MTSLVQIAKFSLRAGQVQQENMSGGMSQRSNITQGLKRNNHMTTASDSVGTNPAQLQVQVEESSGGMKDQLNCLSTDCAVCS